MTFQERVEDLFARGLEMELRERREFLVRECGGDTALLTHVSALLASDVAAGEEGFLGACASELEAAGSAYGPGDRVGHYRLAEEIGTGGMGTVFRAVRADAEYEQTVAVKLIRGGLDTGRIVRRFRHERQILARLSHPNITQLLDGGTTPEGTPYFVMECVTGEPLDAYCRARKLSVHERLRLFRKVCGAVHYAHQHMVVHCDLKPGNILVTADGEPKLLDFGIATLLTHDTASPASSSLTQSGLLALTPRYASPEQLRGEPATTASDVYALGIILFELLTGQEARQHRREGWDAVKPSALAPDPGLRRALRGDLDRIVLTALQAEPSLRYGSVDQFSDDLLRHLEGRPVRARGEGTAYVAARFVRRHKLGVAATLALLLALAGGAVATKRAQQRAERRFAQLHKLAHSVVFEYHDAIEKLPGSTPVRAQLVRDALEYLDSLSAEADDAALQRELVEAYVKLSNVQGNGFYGNLGNSSGALKTARKAVALGQKLLARDRSAASAKVVAAAYSAEGSLLWSLDDLRGAAEVFPKAVALEEDVNRQTPADVTNLVRWSEDLRGLSDVLGAEGLANLGRSREAAAISERALAVSNRAMKLAPQSVAAQREQYHCLMAMAASAHMRDQHGEATGRYREALAVMRGLSAQDPGNPADRREVANTLERVASELQDSGATPAEVRAAYEEGIGLAEQACAADPRNALYLRTLQVLYGKLASFLEGTPGQAAASLAYSQKSLALAEATSRLDPHNSEYQSGVAVSHRRVAAALLANGQPEEALREAELGVELLEQMVRSSSDVNLHTSLVRGRTGKGDIEQQLRRYGAALADYREAARRAKELLAQDGRNGRMLLELAISREREGACLEALHGGEAATAYREAGRAWAELAARGGVPARYREQAAKTTERLRSLEASARRAPQGR